MSKEARTKVRPKEFLPKSSQRLNKVDFKSHGKSCQACWVNFSAIEHYIVHIMAEDCFKAENFDVQMELCNYFKNLCLQYYKEDESYQLDKYFFFVFFYKFGFREGVKFLCSLCITYQYAQLSVKLENTLSALDFKEMIAMNARYYKKICGVAAVRHKVLRISVIDVVALHALKQPSDWTSLNQKYWQSREDLKDIFRNMRRDFVSGSISK